MASPESVVLNVTIRMISLSVDASFYVAFAGCRNATGVLTVSPGTHLVFEWF
jgi:hypothetical protein